MNSIILNIWVDLTLSYGPMSHMVSNMSLGKCGDFRAGRMAVHPSFLLAFSLLLLIDIYVYLVNGFMYYIIQF